jgi:hypothetical protein
VPGGIALDVTDLPPTPAARMAQDLVLREWQRHRQGLLNDFLEHGDDRLPKQWLESTAVNTSNARLTAPQLKALVRDVNEVLDRHLAKHQGQKNHPVPGSRPVQIQLNAFPVLDADETPGLSDDDTTNSEGRES